MGVDRERPRGTGTEPAASAASALGDAFAVDAHSSDARLAAAAQILTDGTGIVLLERVVALRRTPTHIACEVVDPSPAARRCEQEFEVLVENAYRALETSRLAPLLPDLPRRWRVVGDGGTGFVELWRPPA